MIIISFILLLYFNSTVLTLKIYDLDKNNLIFSEPVKNTDSFTIKYNHSVARTPVFEIFIIQNEKIYLKKTIYQSYGAGLPFLNKNDYKLKNDKFIIDNIDQQLPEILLRVSSYAEHKFIYADNTYKLYSLSEDENLLKIYLEREKVFSKILEEIKNV